MLCTAAFVEFVLSVTVEIFSKLEEPPSTSQLAEAPKCSLSHCELRCCRLSFSWEQHDKDKKRRVEVICGRSLHVEFASLVPVCCSCLMGLEWGFLPLRQAEQN